MIHATKKPRRCTAPFAVAIAVFAAASIASAQNYEIVGMGSLNHESSANGVNDRGQVVGYSDGVGGGPTQAVRWENGGLTALGRSYAWDINSYGHVVGQNQSNMALLWKWGQPIELGTLPGFSTSSAVAINDLNQVLCTATGGLGLLASFVWEDEIVTELGTLGGAKCKATDINNVVQVVGQSSAPSGLEHAFIWQDGVMTDLGLFEGDTTSLATAINNNGVVVGYSVGTNGDTPCIWTNNQIDTLPRLGGDRWTYPYGLNDQGVIVGIASSIDLGERAVMWKNGEVIDLNTYAFGTGWVLESALAINNRGWIIGVGRHDGHREGYVLIPGLTLDADQLTAGHPALFTLTDGTSNTIAYLAYSTSGFGSTYIPQLGVNLDLDRPSLAASGRTDSQGRVMWTINVPPGSSGVRVLFQAAQISRTSNVLVRIIN